MHKVFFISAINYSNNKNANNVIMLIIQRNCTFCIDENPSLRIESFAIINLGFVSTKIN